MTIGSILQAIVGILLIHGNVMGIFDDTIGYPNARFGLGVVFVIVPLTFLKSMYPSAKPHKIYQDFIDEFKNAEKFGCALKKFDSHLGALEKWLKVNAISLKLFGLDIDNELPSKIIAGLLSLLGAISLFVYRATVNDKREGVFSRFKIHTYIYCHTLCRSIVIKMQNNVRIH